MKVRDLMTQQVATIRSNDSAAMAARLVPPVLVACNQGVYLSLVGNLVRNAIKYMGPSEPRRITLRVVDHGSSVRTEVIDTGPGIATENLPSLFDHTSDWGGTARKTGWASGSRR